ncbi:PH domain-containing protein [Paractinoplanes atraurantiacus]|uniref:Putative membrane protein n=1 Tax=Paractinoplanes atraurantiacus TaxID=1036182 RepID=A0A285H6C0_9ACTN|nr:PH domain-containing protein [Actinoplanes atraurantiacus]SNY31332.1 putative membrane protein [Actinoplanes atraurantiacus]
MSGDDGWRRLSVRVVYMDLIRAAFSCAVGYLGAVAFNDDGPVWALVAGSLAGFLGALLDLVRWMTTRYRVSAAAVEMRSGWAAKRHRTVARDRIRTVDSSAKLVPRLFRLRVMHIGSGEQASSFTLNALDSGHAARLRRELLPSAWDEAAAGEVLEDGADPAVEGDNREAGASHAAAGENPEAGASHAATGGEREAGAGHAADGEGRTAGAGGEPREIGARAAGGRGEGGGRGVGREVIARLRWGWVPLNAVSVWGPVVVVGPVFALYWFLRPFGVDLLGVGRELSGWDSRSLVWNLVLCAVILYPFGVVGSAVSFVVENWGFELAREGDALVTRRGLLTTRTLQRDDRRMRGLAFREPLVWRWLRLAETSVVTTGLRQTVDAPSGAILPRLRLSEAREIAGRLLPDGRRPLEAELVPHPLGALRRRLGWAISGPVVASVVLLFFDGWFWPLALVPVTLVLAVVAYRSLGHALDGPYLVVRRGALSRNTVALQHGAVIGWTLRQSLLQRWGGRMTVGIATAAGERHYQAPDMGVEQALVFISGATPELAARFIEGGGGAAPGRHPALRVCTRSDVRAST